MYPTYPTLTRVRQFNRYFGASIEWTVRPLRRSNATSPALAEEDANVDRTPIYEDGKIRTCEVSFTVYVNRDDSKKYNSSYSITFFVNRAVNFKVPHNMHLRWETR
ncbi:hypothetical protein KM043_000405 [Ampulex compressa]|nr:hypothetical protein KM043_000405 [Ampulex compressa]